MLEIKRLTAGYGRHTVLHNLSVQFRAGRLTCIVGPNGCGKSTLLKAAVGILPHTSGEILFNGVDLTGARQTDVAKRIAYLTQTPTVPQMTVEQLVLQGRFPYLHYPRGYTDKDLAAADAAIKAMKIEGLASTPLSALSGGLRQSAYLAMALAQDTKFILLDEPTTHLDIKHQLETLKLLRQLANDGRGIAAVIHDLPLALTFADEIAVIQDGSLLLQAPPKKVYESGILSQLFDIPIKFFDNRYFAYSF